MKIKVGFICVHNSCRSQMAEAMGKLFASDVFESYSAGTETKPEINKDAVRIVMNKHGINMNETQESKLIDVLPELDIVVTMGCNVDCPYLPSKHREDWGLDDPSGHDDDFFNQTLSAIEEKILDLKERIKQNKI